MAQTTDLGNTPTLSSERLDELAKRIPIAPYWRGALNALIAQARRAEAAERERDVLRAIINKLVVDGLYQRDEGGMYCRLCYCERGERHSPLCLTFLAEAALAEPTGDGGEA